MVRCETCGQEFKTTQALGGHRAAIHEGRAAPGDPRLMHPERALVERSEPLRLALNDLCPDCQGKVKDKLVQRLDQVEVQGSSSSGLGWLLVAILGLAWWTGQGAQPGAQDGQPKAWLDVLTKRQQRKAEAQAAAQAAAEGLASAF